MKVKKDVSGGGSGITVMKGPSIILMLHTTAIWLSTYCSLAIHSVYHHRRKKKRRRQPQLLGQHWWWLARRCHPRRQPGLAPRKHAVHRAGVRHDVII